MLYSAPDGYTQFSRRARVHFLMALFLVSFFHVVLVVSLWSDVPSVSHSPQALRMVARTLVLPAPAPAAKPQQAAVVPPLQEAPKQLPVTPRAAPVPKKTEEKQASTQARRQVQGLSAAKNTPSTPAILPRASHNATPSLPVTGTEGKSVPPVEARPVIETPPRHDVAYLQNPAPDYPVLSRRRREEGTVYLQVWVSESGNPDKIQIARSSGFTRLDEAARQTVMQWRFVPARRGNNEIDAEVTVPIVFRLNK